MKSQWSLIVALLFSLLIAVFAIVNNEVVVINFLFSTVEISLVLVILGSAAIGAVIMVFLSLLRHVRAGFQMRDLNKKIRLMEEELAARDESLAEKQEEAAALEESLKSKDELIGRQKGLLAQKDREAGKALTEEEKVDSSKGVDIQEGQ